MMSHYEDAVNIACAFGYPVEYDGIGDRANGGMVRYCAKRNQITVFGPEFRTYQPNSGALLKVGVAWIVTLESDGSVHTLYNHLPAYVGDTLRYVAHARWQVALKYR